MHPLSPFVSGRESVPDVELLRRSGWSINSLDGPYCVAWQDRDEVVFQWKDGAWHRVGGRRSGSGI